MEAVGGRPGALWPESGKKISGIEWNPGKPQSCALSDWGMVLITINS